jgi:hypothetical protein
MVSAQRVTPCIRLCPPPFASRALRISDLGVWALFRTGEKKEQMQLLMKSPRWMLHCACACACVLSGGLSRSWCNCLVW